MNKTDILIAQPVDPDVIELLSRYGNVTVNPGPEPLSAQELALQARQARALMVFMTERIDGPLLAQCPDLKIIAGALKGFDNIDLQACSERSVAVSIVPDLLTRPTAELALALMINVARQVMPASASVRAGEFRGWRPRFFGASIDGATVGVVGAGKVGQALLKLLTGFDCQTCYTDTAPLEVRIEQQLQTSAVTLDELVNRADFVVLALPLNPTTQGLVDTSFISRMKPGSFLVNPARGSLVNEAAVAQALGNQHLAGYAADVFEMEDWARNPRPAQIHPDLIDSPKTVLTPHIGSAVTEVRRQIVLSAAESIVAVLSGSLPETVINRETLAG